MIKNYLVTGDTHGRVIERLSKIENYNPAETAVIILGDAGINFYLNKTDYKNKQRIQKTGYTIYCVRGNHEARPQSIPGMQLAFDENVENDIYFEADFPNIRYFVDGNLYCINGHSTLVVGGAYSVDKWYRLAGRDENTMSWTGWFADEQLNEYERNKIFYENENLSFDFVLTHTCPRHWEPTDLFLPVVDQSKVDKTTENYLELLKRHIDWNIWLFGHYHVDRLERPHVQQMYYYIEDLETIWNRWNGENPTINEEYWLTKSPYYYEGVNNEESK